MASRRSAASMVTVSTGLHNASETTSATADTDDITVADEVPIRQQQQTSLQQQLQTTLDANRTLQETLKTEFRSLTEAIHHNRAKANQLVQRQLLRLKGTPNADTGITSGSNNRRNATIRTNTTGNAGAFPNTGYPNYRRRWTKRFFVDHKGSEPKPNVDTLRRRKIEEQSFFHHTQPPWTFKESHELMSIVQDVRDVTNTRGDCDHVDAVERQHVETINFQAVADMLNQNYHGLVALRSNKSKNVLCHQRSAKECEIHFGSEAKKNTTKILFNDVQQRTSLSQVVARMVSAVGASNMDWEKVAESLSADIVRRQSQNTSYSLTAWDVLLAYHTKLKTPLAQLQTATSVWTREEDELLLKFIAAAGPQMVMESKNTLLQSTLCTQLLPHKSKKQIFTRANHSLLNPNMQRNDWSDYEERRLPICMKIYYTPSPQDGYQMYCASTHCYGRSTKSVVDKWNRSINPAYSTKPFTSEEDKALLQVMRSILEEKDHNDEIEEHLQQHVGWVELSQTYFPQRHPQRLQSRWSELATDQDIVNREQAKFSAAVNNITNATIKEGTNIRSHQRRQRKHPTT